MVYLVNECIWKPKEQSQRKMENGKWKITCLKMTQKKAAHC